MKAAARNQRESTAKPKKKAERTRKEQQRAVETRQAILDAALSEFAERGFEGASIRRIGQRAAIDYTLITYHFKNKITLWKAVAQDSFVRIEEKWDEVATADDMSAVDRLREEFRTFLEFTIEHPDFHRFMLSENYVGSPRLAWLIENFLKKTQNRLMRQIADAQAEGHLVSEDPMLIYYMILGMATVLTSLSGEISAMSGISVDNRDLVDSYWRLIDKVAFGKLS